MSQDPTGSLRWGDATITGRANVHQGNRYITNHIYIRPGQLELLQAELGSYSLEAFGAHSPPQIEAALIGQRARHHEQENSTRASAYLDDGNLTTSLRVQECCSSRIPIQEVEVLGTPTEKTAVLSLLQKFQSAVATCAKATAPNALYTFPGSHLIDRRSQQSNDSSNKVRLLRAQELPSDPDYLLWICLFIVTYLLGRNLNRKDVTDLAARIHHDRLYPFMCALLTFVLTRYLYFGTIAGTLSIGDHLVLEDAYGVLKPIPLAVCQDWYLMKECLQTHYRDTRGTVAGFLVQADMFSLTLNSRRRGAAIRSEDWSQLTLKPGVRVINSVHINTNVATCLTCLKKMRVTGTGEFICADCKVFYKDVGLPQRLHAEGPTLPPKHEWHFSVSASSTLTYGRIVQYRAPQHRAESGTLSLVGLKHVDLRLMPSLQHYPQDDYLEYAHRMATVHGYGSVGIITGDAMIMNDNDLRRALNQFGPLVARIDSTNCCAYVTFMYPKSMTAAFQSNPHTVGNATFSIEYLSPRSPKPSRDVTQETPPSSLRFSSQHSSSGENDGAASEGRNTGERPRSSSGAHGRSSRSPLQKNLLSQALVKANQAVASDNVDDRQGAIAAYAEACDILEQVMLRCSDREDREKLSAIRNTYSTRIAELYDLDTVQASFTSQEDYGN